MVNCGVCLKAITSKVVKLVCSDCNGEFHATCSKMSKADIECITADGLVGRCVNCATKRRKSMRLDSSVDQGNVTLDDLMTAIKEIGDSQKISKRDFNIAFEIINTKLNENTLAIKVQSEQYEKCIKVVEELISENKQLKEKVKKLEKRLEDVEQYSRSNTLEIHGIPTEKNDNVLSIVKEVGRSLDLDINDTMVDACHRLGNNQNDNPPGIIVKFVRRMDKEEFIRKRRVKRTLSTRHINRPDDRPIYVSESLTPNRRRLLAMARAARKERNYKFLWVRNGRIFLRKDENAAVKIVSNQEDLTTVWPSRFPTDSLLCSDVHSDNMADISKADLKKEIAAVLKDADLTTMSAKKVREEIEEKLDCDLTSRKKEIDDLVMQCLKEKKGDSKKGSKKNGKKDSDDEDGGGADEDEEEEEEEEEEEPEDDASEEEKPKRAAKKPAPKRKKGSSEESEEEDDKDSEDEYSPAKKAKGKPKGKGRKKKKGSDSDSDEDWGKNKKAKKGGGGKRAGTGYTKVCTLSPELAAVVGQDSMARHEVVKKIWSIIKEKNLYDPKNKQFAICNDEMLKVFGVKRFRTFGMMKYLKDHFVD